MGTNRKVFNGADFERAVREGALSKIVSDCSASQYNEWTVQQVLDIGVSNPYAEEFSLSGEIQNFEEEVDVDLVGDANDVLTAQAEASGSPTSEFPEISEASEDSEDNSEQNQEGPA